MIGDIRTVEFVLREWGKWAYINRGLALDFSSIEPHERMRQVSRASTALTDGEAEAVDAVVSVMRCRHKNAHDAVALHYVAGLPYRKVGQHLSVHHRTAADWIEQGRMYVEAALVFGAPNTQ